MNPSFIHLRVHSEFSLVDGTVRIKPLIQRLVSFSMPAVALTEQSNLFSLVKFYRATQGSGIKPIVGSDVFIYNTEEPTQPFVLTLLAMNHSGYISLTELISKSYQEGQHLGVPMLQYSWIEQKTTGLIALSGAMDGDIGRALLTDNREMALAQAHYWSELFPERFYLDIQRIGKKNEEAFIKDSVDLALEITLALES